MHFSLNFTIIFSLDLTHLLSSERIHKNWQKITDFFKLTLFKWFALKNVIFIWLIIQIQSSEAQLTVQTWASKYKRRPILKEAQLKDQEFWAALIGARAWSSGFRADALHYLYLYLYLNYSKHKITDNLFPNKF